MSMWDKRIDLDKHVAHIADVLRCIGDRYVIVERGLASDSERGAALMAAYAAAKTMTPSEASQVWVLIPPGKYDVGENGFILDTQWINIAGIVQAKVANAGKSDMALEPTVLIYGAVSAANSGVIKQTENNICICDVEIRNTATDVNLNHNNTDPAAYWPNDGVTGTSLRRVKIIGDCGMSHTPFVTRLGVEYKQKWNECFVSGIFCIGGSECTVSGTLIECTINGNYCVGGNYGTVSGNIIGCTISGDYCVGGNKGKVTGTITDCTISGNYCVGGHEGQLTGTITDCTISGYGCVGGEGGHVSGTITGCTISGEYCVGGNGMIYATITNCTISGDGCICGDNGMMSGTIKGCTISGNYCVGFGGYVSGTLDGCTISGEGCVGGGGGTISGVITDCTISGDYSVGCFGTITATARLTDVSVSGTDALMARMVASDAEFVRVSGVPSKLPSLGGKYLNCILVDGILFSSGFTSNTKE